MNRVKDYTQFVIGFVGIGYMVLWPLTAHDNGVVAFGTALVCRGRAAGWIAMACDQSHGLRLSPGLHVLGLASAACVMIRLVSRQWRRRRDAAAAAPHDPSQAGQTTPPCAACADAMTRGPVDRVAAALRRSITPPRPSPRAVRPRRDFGLRGAPH